jgi:hypothetical protein
MESRGSHEAKSRITKSRHAEGKAVIRAMRHCALAPRTPFMLCRQQRFAAGCPKYARRAEVSAPCSGSDRDIGRHSNTSKIDNTSKIHVAARMQTASAFDTRTAGGACPSYLKVNLWKYLQFCRVIRSRGFCRGQPWGQPPR